MGNYVTYTYQAIIANSDWIRCIDVPADPTPRIKEEHFATLITDEDEDA